LKDLVPVLSLAEALRFDEALETPEVALELPEVALDIPDVEEESMTLVALLLHPLPKLLVDNEEDDITSLPGEEGCCC